MELVIAALVLSSLAAVYWLLFRRARASTIKPAPSEVERARLVVLVERARRRRARKTDTRG